MEEIVDSVKRVTDIISEIAAASQEQASGIEQVNQAISQMDEVTQQNASLVEQAAAAAESMQEQTGNLSQVVSVFKLSGAQAPAKQEMVRPKPRADAIPHVKANVPKLSAKRVLPKTAAQPGSFRSIGNAPPTLTAEWEQF
ncbi:MAG: methyl-accepting chemotaxis protein, partial [Noviherbaspirillum sp.]